uniref:Putative LOV domain-containing protein n=1 Tax=Euploca karwinskyi TaxID=1799585 RepID=A0A126WZU3_9ASTE|nr:putative LOV domain-containing protein [Euploca karwinskyi]
MESQLGSIEESFNIRYSASVREALDELADSFTITDPCISGHPIVYVSSEFLTMFGYTKEEVVGRNGRMFQGPNTNRRSVLEIREAIREERPVQVSLLNYRKDGTPFWMLFHMCPVYSKDDGRVTHFVGVQVPILKRNRLSGCGITRNGVAKCDDRADICEAMFRCCRREVCSDSVANLGRALAQNSAFDPEDGELEVDEHCEASEFEKKKSTAAISNILSVLTHYSELTGRLVCGKRCCLPGINLINTALNISLGRIKQSFVLSTPCLPDMPIVYASDAFLKLTGYALHEVLGHNCRFLSGLDTDPATLYQMKKCIESEQACTVRILNYRKDKTSFWNFLHISPVRNASGKVAYFVGVQVIDVCNNREKKQGLSPEMNQLSAVAAVKVAVRSLTMVSTC